MTFDGKVASFSTESMQILGTLRSATCEWQVTLQRG
jgi:hypothetical protein